MSEIGFTSAFDAVRFALCYSMQQYGETPMAKRLNGGAMGNGMGLVGLDGAGQAGEIRRLLWELSDLHLAVVIARAAPHDMPCDCGRPCCSKKTPNLEWQAAIGYLTKQSAVLCSGFSHYRVRRSIIEKVFGVKLDLAEIAQECDAALRTAEYHNSAVRKWIEGDKKTDSRGISALAWDIVERQFDECGLLQEYAA